MPKDKEEKKKLVVVEEVEVDRDSSKEQKKEPKESEEANPDLETVKEEVNASVSSSAVDQEKNEAESAKQPEKVEEEYIEYQEKSQGLMWIIVLTALLVGALAGGFITYFSGLSRLNGSQATPTPQASIEPTTPTPTPTPSTGLKREDLKIQVLNGSGIAGAAGKVKAALEKLGYKDVVAGNASSSDVSETEISITKAKEGYLDMIKTDLGDDYTISKTVKTLPTSSKYDVIITLGKK